MALRMKNVLSKSGSPVVKVLGSFDSQNPNYMRFDTDSWLTGEYDRTLYERIVVPCGHCVGCRLKRSRDWALRCMCEASLYKENCFVTITYDDEHLTGDRISLSLDDVQKFIKRVRKKFSERKVRVFYCGEYGSKSNRPHFHIIFLICSLKIKYYGLFGTEYVFTVRRRWKRYGSLDSLLSVRSHLIQRLMWLATRLRSHKPT